MKRDMEALQYGCGIGSSNSSTRNSNGSSTSSDIITRGKAITINWKPLGSEQTKAVDPAGIDAVMAVLAGALPEHLRPFIETQACAHATLRTTGQIYSTRITPPQAAVLHIEMLRTRVGNIVRVDCPHATVKAAMDPAESKLMSTLYSIKEVTAALLNVGNHSNRQEYSQYLDAVRRQEGKCLGKSTSKWYGGVVGKFSSACQYVQQGHDEEVRLLTKSNSSR